MADLLQREKFSPFFQVFAILELEEREMIGNQLVNQNENNEFKATVDDPEFFAQAFAYTAHQRKISFATADSLRRAIAEEYQELSKRVDITRFQESCSVRNVLRTRRLVSFIIDDKGEINLEILDKTISYLREHLYFIGPDRQYDSVRQEHILKALTFLRDRKDLLLQLKSIGKPYSNRLADQMIRDTLILPGNTPITDAHARRAVLAAWMCYLRQNIGSCFATAPCIIVHDEQPEQFLTDIKELMGTGRLIRTYGGIEYSVPISNTWGAGDLKKLFYLNTGDAAEQNHIWQSPGILAAFESVGLIDPEASLHQQVDDAKKLILGFINELETKQFYMITSAEEIIRKVLLKHSKITEQDLVDYENRPQGMIQGGLLMQTPVRGSGKGEACATFLTQFDIACNALKALADNALLKCWEFTIASFAETKSQFTRWNLYSSLGLGSNEEGGIGARIQEIVKFKLDEANQKVKDIQYEYETIFAQLKTMEMTIKHASSEKDVQWMRAEYQTKRNEFYTLEDIRDENHRKAQLFADLHNILMEKYDELFPKYFQEVYDADMHDIAYTQYDDSPAGFRLLYKYGRSNTSQWSRVKNANQYIEALASFFTATENELTSAPEFKGIEQDISEIITAIVSHVRTTEFLETSFYRMAAAHKTRIVKDPLNHLDEIEKKPWAYTSGGTMGTLVSCYYKREQKPTEVERWVENPLELLVFFIDSLKQIPPKLMDPYLSDPKKSMLMHSPTHAFLLKPGASPFKESWQNDAFTYIWARDNVVVPRQQFVQKMWLDEEAMHYLVEKLSHQVPENYRHFFLKTFNKIYGTMDPKDFREHILDGVKSERGLQVGRSGVINAEEVDSILYSLLPLFSHTQLRERVEKIFSELKEFPVEKVMQLFDQFSSSTPKQRLISSTGLQNICKGLICLMMNDTTSAVDYHHKISCAAQKLGYAMPPPIRFADTNWVKEEFGFLVNPGTGRFELWRVSNTGQIGYPMSSWAQWLNGSRKDITWGIYSRPYEYSPAV